MSKYSWFCVSIWAIRGETPFTCETSKYSEAGLRAGLRETVQKWQLLMAHVFLLKHRGDLVKLPTLRPGDYK